MTARRTRALIGALILGLAACSSPGADLNDAEVEFLTGMIPHHRQAVEMAEMALDNTDRPELRDMADDVITAQTAEIMEMTDLLETADEPIPAASMDGMNHDDMNMAGMMSSDAMSELGAMTGTNFDLMFLDMMTEHHQGAIEAAQEVLATEPRPETAELANAIIDAQQAEIEQMDQWAEAWR